jgi:hypothetical protein
LRAAWRHLLPNEAWKLKASRTPLVTVLILLPPILLGGCTDELPTVVGLDGTMDQDVGQDASSKVQPGSIWSGRAHLFVDNLQVHALAATPTRLLATTLHHDEKLVTLDALGTVGSFSPAFTAAPDAACFVAISPGWNANLPVDEVWVTRGNELLRLSTTGEQLTSIATLPASHGDITGLCFDHVGTFDHALLLLSAVGSVHALQSPTLPLSLVGNMGPGGCAPNVASSRFGAHAGNLVVSYPQEHVVRGMDAIGRVTDIVGWSGVTAALSIPDIVREYGYSSGAYFVALENGTVHRFAQADLSAFSADLLLSSRYRSGSGLVTPLGGNYTLRAFSRFWGPEMCAAVVQRPAVTLIDVLPQNGDSNPSFIQGSQTLVSVTLLSSLWFSPNLVNTSTVTLAQAAPVPFGKSGIGALVEMNNDGKPDLKLFFRPCDMQAPLGNVSLALEGQTMVEEAFAGTALFTVTAP